MTTIVAVDPSLTGTGIAAWRDGRIIPPVTISTPSTVDGPARHHTVVMRLLAMADPIPGRTLYVLEDLLMPVGQALAGNSWADLAKLRGVVEYGIHQRHHTQVAVNPSTLKLYATGRGRASKQEMLTAAHGRLSRFMHCRDHNQADAGFLLAMALHHYGQPLWTPPVKQRAAAERPTWPPFRIEDTRQCLTRLRPWLTSSTPGVSSS